MNTRFDWQFLSTYFQVYCDLVSFVRLLYLISSTSDVYQFIVLNTLLYRYIAGRYCICYSNVVLCLSEVLEHAERFQNLLRDFDTFVPLAVWRLFVLMQQTDHMISCSQLTNLNKFSNTLENYAKINFRSPSYGSATTRIIFVFNMT